MASCAPSEDDQAVGEWQVVKRSSQKERINHPVFKKLCIASGEVNSLSKAEIKERLKALGLASKYVISLL